MGARSHTRAADHDMLEYDIYWTYLAPGYVRTEIHDRLTDAKREDLSSFMVGNAGEHL